MFDLPMPAECCTRYDRPGPSSRRRRFQAQHRIPLVIAGEDRQPGALRPLAGAIHMDETAEEVQPCVACHTRSHR